MPSDREIFFNGTLFTEARLYAPMELYIVRATGWYPRKRGVDGQKQGPQRKEAKVPRSWIEGRSGIPSDLRVPVVAENKEGAEQKVRDREFVEEVEEEATVIGEYVGQIPE